MSNPTPILNNINAFDATKGTTISFNIIGGTDIVRSNIVYIYDLSTNDLICTHLYISTESIHELPPNTDSSIVYASGKSSADFVNNKNYYLQIQTFTNTAGTVGGSGMSVAKTFWCLFNPALSVNAIPAAISTTSYNVGATYTTNITDVTIPVTNIIQQYKFDLYTATGTLVQTSGNIIGSGEQEGTSTTYNITYNFSGLVVNNSYYVVVTTTSTEGMTVSAQSNTFAVSVDTPTVGGAIVNNNACDGYISVVSNLSDEYGGSASGEIASFVTDSVNNVSSLKVNMEPIQEGSGTPSPTNVRPISGWDNVSVVVSPTQSAEDGTTYTTDLNQTVYGGTLDLVTGVLTVDRAMVDLGTATWYYVSAQDCFYTYKVREYTKQSPNLVCSNYPYVGIYADLVDKSCGYIYGNAICIRDSSFNQDASAFKTAVNGVQLVYELATPQTYQLTPHQIQTLVGQNNVWSDAGNVEITFNLPISNLLVKRQDASDVSGDWLTLYSQPITQASDMDFTFIDFLNQHGKTYRYALVPLLTQQQGDIDVEIEGGYTVSDDVLSVFDGVFVANSNGSQKLKASTEYGDLETNQDVGVLTTIGGKYPFVVSNSNLNYHSGSISALIVPSDFYTNGDLDRLDIVERREAIEQFLTDKTAKILKDWNGNIWLITFVENVEVSFLDDYGMGLGTLSAKWVEIGDVNDQKDLQQTGLI